MHDSYVGGGEKDVSVLGRERPGELLGSIERHKNGMQAHRTLVASIVIAKIIDGNKPLGLVLTHQIE